MIRTIFTDSKKWTNIALNQPAWASFDSQNFPASLAVDDDVSTIGHSGIVAMPFLAVDLGSNVPVGTASLRFAGSKRVNTALNRFNTINLLNNFRMDKTAALQVYVWATAEETV